MAFLPHYYVQQVPMDLSKNAAISSTLPRLVFPNPHYEQYMPIPVPCGGYGRMPPLGLDLHTLPNVSRPMPINNLMPPALRESAAACVDRSESDVRTRISSHLSPSLPHISPELPLPAAHQRSTVSPRNSTVTQSESLSDDEEYLVFERETLDEMERRDGALLRSNPRMRRAMQTTQEDEQYRQRRHKNNMAAKQSRNRRKLREIRNNLKVVYLNQQIAAAKAVLATRTCLRCGGPRPSPS